MTFGVAGTSPEYRLMRLALQRAAAAEASARAAQQTTVHIMFKLLAQDALADAIGWASLCSPS